VADDAKTVVQRLLERQRREAAALTGDTQRKLAGLLDGAQADIERALRRYQDSAPDSFSAHHYRTALARVKAIAHELEDQIADAERGKGLLVDAATRARELGLDHLSDQVAAFSREFEGSARTVDMKRVERTLNEVLLDRYQDSVRAYGFEGVRGIQRALAQAQIAGAFPGEMVTRVLDSAGFARAERWKAERIVRTELAHSYSAAHLEGLKAANEEDPGYQKQLVATFDERTGNDSRFVHGQVRELDEDFEDSEGRRYAHPPNRPNDREVEVATRAEWREEGGVAEAVEEGEAGG
jgi:hypothetical protein